ncbi:UNVERIFIED_CONTAM: gas vesicle protein [Euhalothece sp. KZN 001]
MTSSSCSSCRLGETQQLITSSELFIMSSRPHQRSIPPKISSIPRQKSEATTHLEIYKMSVEKHRLQQELKNLKNREKQISKRLKQIEQHTEDLLSQVHSPEEISSSPQPSKISKGKIEEGFSSPQSAFDFEQVYVDY